MIVIKTTYPSLKEAQNFAALLITAKLAKCVQIKKIESFYIWNNELNNEEEFEVSIKTMESFYEKVEDFIIKNHPYEVPQIFSIKANNCFEKYENWIGELSEKNIN